MITTVTSSAKGPVVVTAESPVTEGDAAYLDKSGGLLEQVKTKLRSEG